MSNTQLLNVRSAINYYNPLTGVSNGSFYVFAARDLPWPDDNNPPDIVYTVAELEYNVYNEMLFGKLVDPTASSLMVNRYDWVANTVYNRYDDTDVNLFTEPFYVVHAEAGNYNVFKCLDNNNAVPSTVAPLLSETSANDNYYVTSDGYHWKWLYTIPSATYAKFTTPEYIPVLSNTNVQLAAVNGSVASIFIDFIGPIYNSFTTGSFVQVDISGNTLLHSIQNTNNSLSANANFYNDCSLYIKQGTGIGQARIIQEYIITGSDKRVLLNTPFNITPDLTSIFDIAPGVLISGDGDGAQAIALMNSNTGQLSSIEMVNTGINYSFTNITVQGNTGYSNSSNAVLRGVLSPTGGHGFDVISELNASKVGVSIVFVDTESGTIPAQNTYRRVGLIQSPLYANVGLNLANATGVFEVGETVTQYLSTNTYVNFFVPQASGTVGGGNSTFTDLINVTGIFQTGLSVSGSNTLYTANVVTVNGPDLTFNQTTGILGTYVAGSPLFALDDYVAQGAGPEFAGADGYVNSIDTLANNYYLVHLSNVRGIFQGTDITGNKYINTGDQTKSMLVTNVTIPQLVPYSGNIVYLENIMPITRSNTQTETINLVVDFF